MTGYVAEINHGRGMVAIDTSHGYSIFELMGGDEFEVGDEVSWVEDTVLGSAYVTNRTRNERCEVYFQNHWVSKGQLRQQLLY